jgi:hypothetical protein
VLHRAVVAAVLLVAVAVRADPACDPKTMDHARDAAKNGQWGKALELCEQQLACTPKDGEAIKVCAIASCNLKDCRRSRKYIGQLSSAWAKMVRQVCSRQGIDPDAC